MYSNGSSERGRQAPVDADNKGKPRSAADLGKIVGHVLIAPVIEKVRPG
jgi:hypothetical protein